MTPPEFLIVVPCLNEEAHLPGLLCALRVDPFAARARIAVVDGGSSDRSAEIVQAHAAEDERVTLVHNPQRLQSAAVNLAVARLTSEADDFFIRLDAHAAYPADFLASLHEAYLSSGADSVTVAMAAVAAPRACFQTAAAVAQNSKLGTGGSAHRAAGARRWVDHGHHALFKTSAFRAAGGYDERFSHNEDAEFDTRLVQRGGRILLAADIVMDYVPRSTARGLARQYFNFGRGRARTLKKHRTKLKMRQLAPIVVAPAALAALAAPWAPWLAAPGALWASLCLGYGAVLGVKARNVCACASGFAAAIMHAAWSAGFWREVLTGLRWPRPLWAPTASASD